MNISDISKTTKNVYVLNMTASDLSVTVKDEDGVSRLLRILHASVPQNAAEVVSPLILKKAAAFKRSVASGYLRLLDDDEAEARLSTPEAKMELASIKRKLSRIPDELMLNDTSAAPATPLEAVSGTVNDGTLRAELKDIAVDQDEACDDKFSRLLTLHNESPITAHEATWLISRLPTEGNKYAPILEWLHSMGGQG